MTIACLGYGSFSNAFNSTITPVAPAFSAGNVLVYFSGCYIGSQPTPSPPGGWTSISDTVTCPERIGWAHLATSSSDTIPGIAWGAQWAYAVVGVYSGVDTGFATGFAAAGSSSNQSQNIRGPASIKTPSVNGTVVILAGAKNKTATSDSSVFTAPTNFTMRASENLSGTRLGVGIADFIQTSITSIPASTSILGSVADGSAQACNAVLMSLKPASIVTFIFPPPRPKRIVIDQFYPG